MNGKAEPEVLSAAEAMAGSRSPESPESEEKMKEGPMKEEREILRVAEILTQLDEDVLESGLRMREEYMAQTPPKSLRPRIWVPAAGVAAAAALLLAVLLPWVLPARRPSPENTPQIENVEPKKIVEGTAPQGTGNSVILQELYTVAGSRVTVAENYASQTPLTGANIRTVLSDFQPDHLGANYRDVSGNAYYDEHGDLIQALIYVDYTNTVVRVVIEPGYYPAEALGGNLSTARFNGYEIGVAEFYATVSVDPDVSGRTPESILAATEPPVPYQVDVGMYNGSLGVLVSQVGGITPEFRAVYNYLISCDLLINNSFPGVVPGSGG
ncbi:MAG: hypothetical protein ILP12_02215 [Lachnospiraceae bacterium]|nr:hypothetical protein [Lachnospiraceae bacterium]